MRRKPRPHYKFGGLLEEGIKRLALAHRHGYGKTHEQLARHDLGVDPNTLYNWRRGEHLPQPEVLEKLARIFVRGWNADRKWINAFLDAAEYGPVRAVEALNQELFGDEGRDIGEPGEVGESQAVRVAKKDMQPWTFYIFEGLRAAGRVTERDLLQFTGGLALWLVGWWLIGPFLAWPFPNAQAALRASLQYGAASLVVPLGICLLHGIGRQDTPRPADQMDRWKLWVLRCGGAYVAYHITMVIFLSAAIMLYSAGSWTLPTWLGLIALAMVLLFAYAIAGQFPATRMSDEKGLRFYRSIDIVVLATFVAFGPLVATFFGFVIYPWLLQPYLGGLLLLSGITLAIIISMLEKKTGKSIMLGLIAFEVLLVLAVVAFAIVRDLG